MALVSVIVPVYNAEKHLQRCLDSLIAQTFSDYEVILVNDGSTDRSAEICSAFCEKDSRFSLITQKNSGPSTARNIGIKNSQGKYISFVDSDDYAEPNMLEELLSAAEASAADMVVCGYNKVTNNGISPSVCSYEDGVYKGDAAFKIAVEAIDIHTKFNLPPYSNVHFINADFLKRSGILFNTDIRRSEDYLFWTELRFMVKTLCLICNKKLYNYVYNDQSITNSFVANYWDMSKKIYLSLKSTLPSEVSERLDVMLLYRSATALNNASRAENKSDYHFEQNKITKDPYLRDFVKKTALVRGSRSYGAYFLLLKFHLYAIIRMRYRIKRIFSI